VASISALALIAMKRAGEHEHQPGTTLEHHDRADRGDRPTDRLACVARLACRAEPVAVATPAGGAQDAAAVERCAGEQVEHAEHVVDHAQPGEDREADAVDAECVEAERGAERGTADAEARERAGGGDPGLAAGGRCLAVEAGSAAERPQLDRDRLHAVASGDERVGELVRGDRREERDEREGGAERAVLAGESRAEQQGDEQHAPVELERYAEQPPE
jgi:hypothetical protein